MIVEVNVPPKVLWALTDEAERMGVTVGELLLAAATTEQPMGPLTETTHDRVIRLWRQGLCDADIAARLHMTNQAVSKVRQGMKLPANRRLRPTAEAIRLAAYKQHQAEKRSA